MENKRVCVYCGHFLRDEEHCDCPGKQIHNNIMKGRPFTIILGAVKQES